MAMVFLILFILVSIVHLLAAFFEKGKLRKITKVFLMPLLLAYYIPAAGTLHITVILATVFGWLGDVFLLNIEKQIRFKLGLTSFLLGHLCYIPSFIRFAGHFNIPALIISYLMAIPLEIIIVRMIKPTKEMLIPVALYALVILNMSIYALQLMLSHMSPWSVMVFAGSLCFICSDTILAFFTFREKPKRGDFFIMLTYISAQALIVTALAHI